MAALKSTAIQRFVDSPSPEIGAALIYGPDLGLVRERAVAISRKVCADLSDPFNAIEFTDADLRGEPGRLADEAAALSFTGGRRLIRLRTSGDAAAEAAKALIDGLDAGQPRPNSLVVVEAGDLAKSSRLRKLFEAARLAVAIPCYEDKPEDLSALARDLAAAEGLMFERDALEYAVGLLGVDRGVSRSELEKLITFVGPKGIERTGDGITLGDVRACLVDSDADALYAAAAAAFDGDMGATSAALRRLASAGGGEIGLVRAMQREAARLSAVQAAIASGSSVRDAMNRLRPPVFFGEQRAFSARLRTWSRPRLEIVADLLLDAEAGAKTTGAPSQAIVERAALRIAAMAARR